MRRRFDLLPEYPDVLRCFEYDGLVNNKHVRCIRNFSPYKAEEHNLSIRTSLDLEQHPEMLLYEGHIDSQGNAYVADRRALLRLAKTR